MQRETPKKVEETKTGISGYGSLLELGGEDNPTKLSEKSDYLLIDGKITEIADQENLLELAREIGIDIPSYCNHNQLNSYGSCRLCLVDIEGRGIEASCQVKPEAGMRVKTDTDEINQTRKMNLELLLADRESRDSSIYKGYDRKLDNLIHRFGIRELRCNLEVKRPRVDFSFSLIRDAAKCTLCGDCVKFCKEVQSVGAIDYAFRHHLHLTREDFEKINCVNCGQCAQVCPEQAIKIKSATAKLKTAINSDKKTVIAQIAPAVRVAIGEAFGIEPGEMMIGKIASALRKLGVDKVYDTTNTADLTIIEEGNEFLERKAKGEKLPQFTSCCPGWVKFAEHNLGPLLNNLSSCKSPQSMFGSVIKNVMDKMLHVKKEDLVVVSVMPCTAKKFEVDRPEMEQEGIRDVDICITTQELVDLIRENEIDFANLPDEKLDYPIGFDSGSGLIFGVSGGVSESMLRYVHEKVTGEKLETVVYEEVRGIKGLRESEIDLGETKVKLGIIHGLANARLVAEKIMAGECDYDLIEVMACPGGCIGGGGQPFGTNKKVISKRSEGIYKADSKAKFLKSQRNPFIKVLYERHLGEPGSKLAHKLLHTGFTDRNNL